MGLDEIIFSPGTEKSDLFQGLEKKISVDHLTLKKGINIDNFISLAQQGYFKEPIHKVLGKCEILLCSTPPPQRNAELEKRILKLKAEQANAEYRSMTKSLLPPERSRISLREDIHSVSSQIIAVINFVLTVGGTFCFVYKAVEYALPHENIPAQVLMGILASIVVALADFYFLLQTV